LLTRTLPFAPKVNGISVESQFPRIPRLLRVD